MNTPLVLRTLKTEPIGTQIETLDQLTLIYHDIGPKIDSLIHARFDGNILQVENIGDPMALVHLALLSLLEADMGTAQDPGTRALYHTNLHDLTRHYNVTPRDMFLMQQIVSQLDTLFNG